MTVAFTASVPIASFSDNKTTDTLSNERRLNNYSSVSEGYRFNIEKAGYYNIALNYR